MVLKNANPCSISNAQTPILHSTVSCLPAYSRYIWPPVEQPLGLTAILPTPRGLMMAASLRMGQTEYTTAVANRERLRTGVKTVSQCCAGVRNHKGHSKMTSSYSITMSKKATYTSIQALTPALEAHKSHLKVGRLVRHFSQWSLNTEMSITTTLSQDGNKLSKKVQVHSLQQICDALLRETKKYQSSGPSYNTV